MGVVSGLLLSICCCNESEKGKSPVNFHSQICNYGLTQVVCLNGRLEGSSRTRDVSRMTCVLIGGSRINFCHLDDFWSLCQLLEARVYYWRTVTLNSINSYTVVCLLYVLTSAYQSGYVWHHVPVGHPISLSWQVAVSSTLTTLETNTI